MYLENDIIDECKKKNLHFKRIEYMQLNNKKRRCCVYTCGIHEKYGEQYKTVEKIFSIKQPCIYCNHSRLDLTLQDEVNMVNPNILIIGKYINTDTPIECKCIIHNKIWKSRPLELIKGKTGCSQCIKIKKYNNSKIKSVYQFQQEIQRINPNIQFIGKYVNTHTLTDFKCLIHNIVFQSLPCNILNQTSTCPLCAKENMRQKEGLTIMDIKKSIKDNNLQMEIVDNNYVNTKTPIKCRCIIHNIVYKTQPKTILYRHSSGCPRCFQSVGEYKLKNVLDNLGFNVIPQYSFDDCIYKNKLRFDYYDENKKIAFEYQGQQHYYPVNFGGISNDDADKAFKETIIRDKIKKMYCNKNNIKLICVPYWEYDNMEHFLLNNI